MANRHVRLQFEAVTSQASAALRGLGRDAREVNQSLGESARNNRAEWTQVGVALTAVGAATVLALRQAGKESIEFNAKLTRSVTLVGATRDEVNELGQAALGLTATGRGPMELADALFFVQSAGLRGKDALDVVTAAAQAASLGLGDTATIADLVTSAVNAYGPEALSAAGATDILIGAVREGKAEASDLAATMGAVLPVASNMGISFDQVGAAIAAMTRTGTDAATATTQLRAIMVSLLKPAEQSEQTLREFGLSSEGLRRTIQDEGLLAALMQITGALDGNDAALARVFPNVRALAGVMDLTGASVDTTVGIFQRMEDTTGLLAQGFAEWSQTSEAAQQRFSAAMEALRITYGQDVEPALSGMYDLGTGVALMLADLPDPARRTVTALAGIGGVGATAAGAFFLLVPRIYAMKDAMDKLNLTSTSFIRLLTNPYVAAITVATAGLAFWAQKKAEAKQRVDALTEALRSDTYAIGENTRSHVAARLAQEGAAQAAADLGVSQHTLIDAMLGSGAAARELRSAIEGARSPMFDMVGTTTEQDLVLVDQQRSVLMLERAWERLSGEFTTAAVNAHLLREATSELTRGDLAGLDRLNAQVTTQALALNATSNAARGLGLSYEELTGEAEDTRTSLERLNDVLDVLAGKQLSAEEAAIRVRGGFRDLTETLKENGATLDSNTAKGDANREAIARQARAIIDEVKARHDQGDSLITVGRLYEDRIEDLKETMRQAKISESAIDEYIATLGLTPDDVVTAIIAEADQAKTELERVAVLIGSIPRMTHTTVSVGVDSAAYNRAMGRVALGQPIHTGGYIESNGTIRRYHSGGMVGHDGASMRLAPDEVPAVLQTGELVLSRDQVRMLSSALPALPRTLSSGTGGGSAGGLGAADRAVLNRIARAVEGGALVEADRVVDALDRALASR